MTHRRARLERLYTLYRLQWAQGRGLEHLSDDDLLRIIADGDATYLARLRSMSDEELDVELRTVAQP